MLDLRAVVSACWFLTFVQTTEHSDDAAGCDGADVDDLLV